MAKSINDSPVWFVTGCSTGFGREFVRAALAHGFRVVATARNPKKLNELLLLGHEGLAKALALDVTNAAQIKQAVSEAERAFGRIDVLVNNAGYVDTPLISLQNSCAGVSDSFRRRARGAADEATCRPGGVRRKTPPKRGLDRSVAINGHPDRACQGLVSDPVSVSVSGAVGSLLSPW